MKRFNTVPLVVSLISLSLMATIARAEPKLRAFPAGDHDSYFAIELVQEDIAPASTPERRALDLGIILDLSASEAGPAAQSSLTQLRELAKNLEGGSRLQIWLAHRDGKALLSRPLALGAEALTKAIAELETETPLGATDWSKSLEEATRWLEDTSGSLPKRLVILGSGPSVLSSLNDATVNSLIDSFTAARTPIFIQAASPTVALSLATLAVGTGGCVTLSQPPPGNHSLIDQLEAPVLFVETISIDPVPSELFPKNPIPLRAGAQNLMVGMGSVSGSLKITIRGNREGVPVERSFALAPLASEGYGYLRFLVESWRTRPNQIPLTDSKSLLARAREFSDACTEGWTAQGKAALADNRRQDAEAFFHQVLQAQPHDMEASLGLRIAQKSSSAAASEITTTPESDPIEDAKAREKILKQKHRQEVTQALEEYRAQSKSDPDSAGQILKRALQSLEASGLDEETRGNLRRRLESELRLDARRRWQRTTEQVERDRAAAGAEARLRRQSAQLSQQAIQKQLLEEFRALMAAGDYDAALAAAELAESKSPGELAPTAAILQASLARRYTKIEDVEFAKDSGWWNTLASAEFSSVPIPDNQEIIFPPAKRWEELTARREKYKVFDLKHRSPAEDKIRKSITKPISFDFKETPLSQAMEFVRDFAGINVVIDQAGLDAAGVDPDEPITLSLTEIPLRSGLKLLLEPLELAYLIRDDVLLITSREQAESQLETRVYPVADLVIPITNFNQGGVGMNGTGSGTGQGNQGGLGNSGGGDLGGNLGGGGLRRDISDDLRKILESAGDDQSNSKIDWEKHFATHTEPAPSLRAAVLLLARDSRHEDVVQMLTTALRHQEIPLWAQQCLPLSMQLASASNEEIQQAILAVIDREPNDLAVRLWGAFQFERAGQSKQGIQLLRGTYETLGPSVNVLYALLELSGSARDVETAAFAAQQLLSREWPSHGDTVHDRARQLLDTVAQRFRDEGMPADADRLMLLSREAQERDLEITVRWDGEADIDLAVVEPMNLLCSSLVPATLGGGVLVRSDEASAEKYSAATAFSGDYEIRLTPVWGTPTAGIANVDIVWQKGTEKEKRQRQTVSIDKETVTVRIPLADGRREDWAVPSPDPILRPEAPVISSTQARAELRRLVRDGDVEAVPVGGFAGGSIQVNRTVPFATGAQGAVGGGGAVAFDPVVTPIQDGTSLFAQAVVSADRRFVRLQLVPLAQNVQAIQDVRTIEVGGAVGGGIFPNQ